MNAATLLILASLSQLSPITGRASVVDGDTIVVGNVRIRLNGVDAPESWQACTSAAGESYRCGKDAAFALDDWLAKSRPTTCMPTGDKTYNRQVADCWRDDGASVNSWLVENGWAVDWPKYSHGAFAGEQTRAHAARLGIWAGLFDLPCAARAKNKHEREKC